LTADNFTRYPEKRNNRFPLVSHAQYRQVFSNVIIDDEDIKLPPDREKFKGKYKEDLIRSAGIVCNFISNQAMAAEIDDALYYAYTFRAPEGAERKPVLNDALLKTASTRQFFPRVLKFSFWPWVVTDQGTGLVLGLYVSKQTSEHGVMKLSLYDTFINDNLLAVIKAQNPNFKQFDDGYGALMGKLGEGISAKMPLLRVFIHENNHAIAEDGGNGLSENTLLSEGVTELLTQRAIQYVARGNEDFNDLLCYPEGVIVAALLWSIDPRSLLDWYANDDESSGGALMDQNYLDALVDAMGRIGDANDPKNRLLLTGNKLKFRGMIDQGILQEKIQSLKDLHTIFSANCSMKILWDWLMGAKTGYYFKQLPMKVRLAVVQNFFGLNLQAIGVSAKEFDTVVKDLRSKVKERKNWDNTTDSTLLGVISDPIGKERNLSPVAIIPGEDEEIGENKGGNGPMRIINPRTGVEGGPETMKGTDKDIKVPTPDNAVNAGSSMPSPRKWFQTYWTSHKQARDAEYAPMRDELVKSFTFTQVQRITALLLKKEGINELVLSEWVAFLSEYMTVNLQEGGDALMLPDLQGLFPPAQE
jgi:hypothetical protein